MPEANSDHIVAVLQRQRDQFFNALTVAEINNATLVARVTELEAQIALKAEDKARDNEANAAATTRMAKKT